MGELCLAARANSAGYLMEVVKASGSLLRAIDDYMGGEHASEIDERFDSGGASVDEDSRGAAEAGQAGADGGVFAEA